MHPVPSSTLGRRTQKSYWSRLPADVFCTAERLDVTASAGHDSLALEGCSSVSERVVSADARLSTGRLHSLQRQSYRRRTA
jgi:hypothetical protein